MGDLGAYGKIMLKTLLKHRVWVCGLVSCGSE